jgi:hypothetical protein
VPWRGWKSLVRAPRCTLYTKPRTTTTTHVRGRDSTPRGSSASQPPVVFRPHPRGWLGPARGEFMAPNSPLGPPPVPHAGFLGHWEGQKSVELRPLGGAVVPIKARGRYKLYPAIYCAPGIRRVRRR